MVVEDNGVAVRTKRIEADLFNEGIGLSNIKQRIGSMGGFVTFSRERGFRVFISIPKNK